MIVHRRQFLEGAVAFAAGGLLPIARAFGDTLASPPATFSPHSTGAPQPFDYAWLKGRAKASAAAAYQPPNAVLPPALAKLDYDAFQAIHFRPAASLWAASGELFQLRFFHRGYQYKERVRMHEVVNGQAREIAYDAAMFDTRKAGVDAGALPHDLGFAGFRVLFHTNWETDIAAFLGASYFRAVGVDRQYGLSARGLAINTGKPDGEEFPVFTEYWFDRPAQGQGRLTLYALLESPSIAGAYRIEIAPGNATIMDIDAALYPRKPIERLGIAPLTTMYLCGENDRRVGADWRPEIHDSDGLSLDTGAGEWIWRPLVNAPGTRLNTFADRNPHGFGLLQRDRNFDHYQDDGVFYDKRPSAWVEPKGAGNGGFGDGAVQLLEFPADDETTDNVAAWWSPATEVRPSQELLYAYRLYWSARAPYQSSLARVVATRTGIGGIVGHRRSQFSWRFAIDFAGGSLAALPIDAAIEPVITASRGTIEITSARPQPAIDGYRAMFDIKPVDASVEPVDLRVYLRLDGAALTETWLYQWTPPPMDVRRRLLAG